MTKKANGSRPVLVTTEHRGVFFGYVEDDSKFPAEITLKRMRCCVQWRSMHGFLALASDGPNKDCKIGPYANGTLAKITGYWDVEPKAVEAWEAAPWR